MKHTEEHMCLMCLEHMEHLKEHMCTMCMCR